MKMMVKCFFDRILMKKLEAYSNGTEKMKSF